MTDIRGRRQNFDDVACPAEDCPLRGQKGRKNIVGNGTYLVGEERVRKFICKECGHTFNSRTGTASEGLRYSDADVSGALDLRRSGKSVRETAETVGCSITTIRRWSARINDDQTDSDDDFILSEPSMFRVGEYSVPKHIIYVPERAGKCFRNVLSQQIRGTGIKRYHVPFIAEIGAAPHMSQKALARILPFDKSRISVVVNELMADGYVVNESSSKTWSLVLTAKGRRVLKDIDEVMGRASEKIFADFTAEDLDTYERLVNKMIKHLDEVQKYDPRNERRS